MYGLLWALAVLILSAASVVSVWREDPQQGLVFAVLLLAVIELGKD